MLAGFFRIRYEIQFEAMNQRVFAESSKFAAESIGAFRTVTALTMEDMIAHRYETLLKDHVHKAFVKARWSTAVFAASDSVQLLCMALAFWYGGRMLADRSYDSTQFFVVYIAVINGAEGAGTLLSFGPNMAQVSLCCFVPLLQISLTSLLRLSRIITDNRTELGKLLVILGVTWPRTTNISN